jgi:hypothetical protein
MFNFFKKPRYHYHYYAIYQSKNGGVSHIDGVVDTSHQIITTEQYEEFKTLLEDTQYDNLRLSLCNLTLLGITY